MSTEQSNSSNSAPHQHAPLDVPPQSSLDSQAFTPVQGPTSAPQQTTPATAPATAINQQIDEEIDQQINQHIDQQFHQDVPSQSAPIITPCPVSTAPTQLRVMPDPLTEGDEFMGYKVGPIIGRGAAGIVRLGTDPLTGDQIAIKSMCKRGVSKRMHRCMEREGQVHFRVQHPHIVPVKVIYEDNNFIYLGTEYMSGGSFLTWLRNPTRFEQIYERIFPMFYQLISALRFLHFCRAVHRDIKPENIFMSADGTTMRIGDFGLATVLPDSGDTRLGSACGSPYYCAPEVLLGQRYDGTKVDVWGAGVILHAMTTRFVPFYSPNLEESVFKVTTLDCEVPEMEDTDLQELLQKMLLRLPEERCTLDDVLRSKYWTDNCTKLGLNPEGSHQDAVGVMMHRIDSAWVPSEPLIYSGRSVHWQSNTTDASPAVTRSRSISPAASSRSRSMDSLRSRSVSPVDSSRPPTVPSRGLAGLLGRKQSPPPSPTMASHRQSPASASCDSLDTSAAELTAILKPDVVKKTTWPFRLWNMIMQKKNRVSPQPTDEEKN